MVATPPRRAARSDGSGGILMSNCAGVYAAVLGMQGRGEWNGARPTPSGPRHRLGAWRMTCRRVLRTIADIDSSGDVLGGAHTPTEGELQTLPSTHQKSPADTRRHSAQPLGPVPRRGRQARGPDLISPICCAWETLSRPAALGQWCTSAILSAIARTLLPLPRPASAC